MWPQFKKVIHDCLTENDGHSYCPVRCIGALAIVPAIVLLLWFGAWQMRAGSLTLMGFVQALGVLAGIIVSVFAAGVSLKAMTDKPLPQGGQQ